MQVLWPKAGSVGCEIGLSQQKSVKVSVHSSGLGVVFKANDSDSDSMSIWYVRWQFHEEWLYDMILSSLEEWMSVWVKEWRNTENEIIFMHIESMLHDCEL